MENAQEIAEPLAESGDSEAAEADSSKGKRANHAAVEEDAEKILKLKADKLWK